MISNKQKQWILDQLQPELQQMGRNYTEAIGNIRQKVEEKQKRENTELREFLVDLVECFDSFEEEVKNKCK